jgi:hypothetical protein
MEAQGRSPLESKLSRALGSASHRRRSRQGGGQNEQDVYMWQATSTAIAIAMLHDPVRADQAMAKTDATRFHSNVSPSAARQSCRGLCNPSARARHLDPSTGCWRTLNAVQPVMPSYASVDRTWLWL